ncbi:MAG TPA: GNAT family N-acetyltransferase [Terriglobia bacterium]|nr:GNAT family N-acetyltransferase [Terriglobia bacterium]
MLEIQLLDGVAARPLVDPFYEKNGRRRCARDEDLFFVAIDDGQVLGCVRYCVEADTPMLRTMMVDAAHRRRGIGLRLLPKQALRLYALRVESCGFLGHGENTTFKITANGGRQFLLRIHRNDYHSRDGIVEELRWLQGIVGRSAPCRSNARPFETRPAGRTRRRIRRRGAPPLLLVWSGWTDASSTSP